MGVVLSTYGSPGEVEPVVGFAVHDGDAGGLKPGLRTTGAI
jgi:hypothetical protein